MQNKMIEGYTRIVGQAQGYLGLAILDKTYYSTVDGPNTPVMITAWEPMPNELERISQGAPILVHITGNRPPPMHVTVGEVPK